MALTTVRGRVFAKRRDGSTSKLRRPRRWPVESLGLFLLTFIAYAALADFMVIHVHYMNGDAYARVANAQYVIGTRYPHLGAIGFVWPPLPSLIDLPFLMLGKWFPFVVSTAFAGSISAAMVGAGTIVLLNIALRRCGVIMPVRYLVLLVWLANPEVAVYSAQGMSEGMGLFFMVALGLVFMKWCDTQSARDLTILGIVAGLNSLVREESVMLSVVIGLGVLICSFGRRVSWREIETRALLFGLPFGFLFGGWILAQAILLHDPFYFIHSIYGNGAQAGASNGFGDLELQDSKTLLGSFGFVVKEAVGLFPAAILLAALVFIRLPFARNRRAGIVVLLMGLPIPLVDAYELHIAQYSLQLRHSLWIIAWAAVLGMYLVWDLRRANHRLVPIVAAVAVTIAMGLSNFATFDLMNRNDQISQEYPLIQAIETNTSLSTSFAAVVSDEADYGHYLAYAVAAADKDHGLIAMDTFGGFNIFLNAPDPKIYVVTSDYDFEAVASQPLVYHVEYFLVPRPSANGTLDRFNVLYPSLWSNGSGFATEVAHIGGMGDYKLYKITGPTGRG